tara:strand:- start:408 stop:875 length:468 start_codon:yes stop_codon:yes gene_type:complete
MDDRPPPISLHNMSSNVGEIKLLNAEDSGEASTSRYHGAIAPGEVFRGVGWLPFWYTAWADADRLAGAVLAVRDVDPEGCQCTVDVTDGPGGIVGCHQLRFINREGLEWCLAHAERCKLVDRHHRCTCCLKWVRGSSWYLPRCAWHLRRDHRACV